MSAGIVSGIGNPMHDRELRSENEKAVMSALRKTFPRDLDQAKAMLAERQRKWSRTLAVRPGLFESRIRVHARTMREIGELVEHVLDLQRRKEQGFVETSD